MDKGFTPEERLLKLIKEGARPSDAGKKAEQTTSYEKGHPPKGYADSPEGSGLPLAISAPAARTKARLSVKVDIKRFFAITNINRLLLLLFFIILIWLVYDLTTFVMPRLAAIYTNKDMDFTARAKALPANKENSGAVSESQPLDYYTGQAQKRELFKSVIAEGSNSAGQAPASAAKVKLEEYAKALVLKGVVAGQPAQAIIEDTKAGKTYFVTKGENIGEITIDDITDDRVKLKLEGQSIDLVL